MVILVAGCAPAAPTPATATLGATFTLAPNQTVTLADADLTIQLISVPNDQRCPSSIECAVSGPVSVSLSAQRLGKQATQIDLQTFTSDDGSVPDMQFQGIQDRMVYEGYLIRVVGVLPYPAKSFNEIKASKYRVSLVVSKQ